jgi:hypothetical protein
MLFMILLALPVRAESPPAPGLLVPVTRCAEIGEAGIDAAKTALLAKARNRAADRVLGELWKRDFPDAFVAEVARSFRPAGDPEYTSGKRFGQACIDVELFLPRADYTPLAPHDYILTGFCADVSAVPAGEALTHARDRARLRLLTAVDSRIEPEMIRKKDIGDLLADVDFTRESVDLQHGRVCLDARAQASPRHVGWFWDQRREDLARKAAQTKAQAAPPPPPTTFALPLGSLSPGQPAPYGDNLVVFSEPDGPALGPPTGATGLLRLELPSLEAYDLRVFARNTPPTTFRYAAKTWPLFKVKHAHKNHDYELRLTWEDGRLRARILLTEADTDYFEWTAAANFTEYRIVRSTSEVRFFMNGGFLFRFDSDTDQTGALRLFEMPLREGDRVFGVTVRPLD